MNREISKKLEQILNRILQSAKPVKNLIHFFANLTTSNQNKTPALNKTPQKISSSIQIKKLDHKQQTAITSFFEQTFDPVTQYPPTVITVGKECILDLEPGYVLDACAYMSFEDFSEIKKYGKDIIKKLKNKPIYVLDTIKKEYQHKKCPKNYDEMMRSSSLHPNKYTGEPRNFNHTLADWFESSGVTIYFVEAEKSSEVRKSAKKCLTELKKFGLHKPDHMYLGFARITKSTVMTLDCKMIRSAKKGKVKTIDFREFLDEVMSPEKSPMTRLEEDRRYCATIKASEQVQFLRQLKKKRAKTIELYGNRNSAINSRKKR